MLHPEETQLYKTISNNIRKYAKTMGYTQRELSEVLGISDKYYSHKINNYGSHFNIMEIKKLAEEFLISVDDLLKEDTNEA